MNSQWFLKISLQYFCKFTAHVKYYRHGIHAYFCPTSTFTASFAQARRCQQLNAYLKGIFWRALLADSVPYPWDVVHWCSCGQSIQKKKKFHEQLKTLKNLWKFSAIQGFRKWANSELLQLDSPSLNMQRIGIYQAAYVPTLSTNSNDLTFWLL